MTPTIDCPSGKEKLLDFAQATFILVALGSTARLSTAAEFHVYGQAIFGSTVVDHYDRTEFFQAGDVAKFDDTSHVPDYSVHTQGDSLADIGGLHAHAFAQIIKNVTNSDDRSGIGVTGEGIAVATFPDVVVSGPAGTVSTSINMVLGGSMTAGSFAPGIGHNTAEDSASVVFLVNGSNKGGGTMSLITTDGSVPVFQGSGVLANWSPGPFGFTTPSFIVPTNTPLTLQIQLYAHADVGAAFSDSYVLDANADFANTLKFVSDGPVFNLPAGQGFTVNAPDAGIVDNHYVASEPALPGDYNGNGTVDAADYTIWRDTLGSTTDLRANGDNTGASANVIDLADFLFWKAHFGVPPGSGSGGNAIAAPEPATLVMSFLGLLAMCSRRRMGLCRKLVRR